MPDGGREPDREGAGCVFDIAGDCGLGALAVAKERGVWGIGVDTDQSFLGPHILTSAVTRIPLGVRRALESLERGTFRSGGNSVYGLREGGVGLGKTSPRCRARSCVSSSGFAIRSSPATSKSRLSASADADPDEAVTRRDAAHEQADRHDSSEPDTRGIDPQEAARVKVCAPEGAVARRRLPRETEGSVAVPVCTIVAGSIRQTCPGCSNGRGTTRSQGRPRLTEEASLGGKVRVAVTSTEPASIRQPLVQGRDQALPAPAASPTGPVPSASRSVTSSVRGSIFTSRSLSVAHTLLASVAT